MEFNYRNIYINKFLNLELKLLMIDLISFIKMLLEIPFMRKQRRKGRDLPLFNVKLAMDILCYLISQEKSMLLERGCRDRLGLVPGHCNQLKQLKLNLLLRLEIIIKYKKYLHQLRIQELTIQKEIVGYGEVLQEGRWV